MYVGHWSGPPWIRGASDVSNNPKMQKGEITARNMTGNMGENVGQKFCQDLGV